MWRVTDSLLNRIAAQLGAKPSPGVVLLDLAIAGKPVYAVRCLKR